MQFSNSGFPFKRYLEYLFIFRLACVKSVFGCIRWESWNESGKKKEEGEGGEKRKRCFLLPPHLEILATKLFLVMTWEKVTAMSRYRSDSTPFVSIWIRESTRDAGEGTREAWPKGAGGVIRRRKTKGRDLPSFLLPINLRPPLNRASLSNINSRLRDDLGQVRESIDILAGEQLQQ